MANHRQRDDRGAYRPSPREIRQACLQIQATWSAEERRSRAGQRRRGERVEIQDAPADWQDDSEECETWGVV